MGKITHRLRWAVSINACGAEELVEGGLRDFLWHPNTQISLHRGDRYVRLDVLVLGNKDRCERARREHLQVLGDYLNEGFMHFNFDDNNGLHHLRNIKVESYSPGRRTRKRKAAVGRGSARKARGARAKAVLRPKRRSR